MPRSFSRVAVALVLGACAASFLTPSQARAGIDFQPAAPLPVLTRPLYMVSGDLNKDGRADLVVVSPASRRMSVYLAADTAAQLNPAVSYPLDTDNPRPPTLGYINQDDVLDIAIPVVTEGKIRLFLGNGDGTFTRSLPDVSGFSNPTSVAIGRFRIVNGSSPTPTPGGSTGGDLLVSQRGGTVDLAVNQGTSPPKFLLNHGRCNMNQRCVTGPRPDQVWTLDLNRDNKPDFITFDVGGGRVKSLSVALGDRYEAVSQIYVFGPVNHYLFGDDPASVIITDVNNDGIPDVLGITQDVGASVSKVTVVRGNADGTLAAPSSFTVACPYFVGNASCRGLALTSGDYNGDGDVDLAIALNDPRAESSAQAQDQILVLVGRGNGEFDPGPVFPVGKSVLALASGNIGGDALADVAVTSGRANSVQAFINRSTTGSLGNGEQCSFGDECASSRCIDNVCCATTCADGERCDVPGREGVCQPIPVQPMTCDMASQCESTFCVNGYCCDAACLGGRCDVAGYEGLCIPGRPSGEECDDNTQCESGICSANFVCCNETCETGFCDERGICRPLLDLGDQCNVDQECASTICDNFNGICCADRCDPVTEDCNPEGQCVRLDDTPTQTQTPTVTRTPRSTPAPNGELCSVEGDCQSQNCVNDVCCESTSCPDGQHCAEGSGQCEAGGTPTRTFTPTRIPTATPADPCNPNPCQKGQLCQVVNGAASCIKVSSSSGCSTTGGGGAGNLLVVAAMPFLLWLGRRWQRKLKRAPARARRARR